MKKANVLAIYLSLIFVTPALAQLSPPGMGKTKTAFWSAIGVKQQLDEKNTSMTYMGMGRISGNSDDPLDMPSIFVVNQEFFHRLGPQWKYSLALSYRRQHEYDEGFDEKESAAINQEFRFYGRLQHAFNFGPVKWANTIRQEVRKFYTDDFAQVPDGLQLRTRIKTQLFVSLDNNSVNSLMASAEALFAIADDSRQGWGNMDYKESRFCLYYCLSPRSMPLTLDIGYMNDLSGYGKDTFNAGYLAMDIVVKDPF